MQLIAFDRDKKLDLVAVNFHDHYFSVVRGTGDGGLGTIMVDLSNIWQPVVGDMTADGYPDVVANTQPPGLAASRDTRVWPNSGNGTVPAGGSPIMVLG